jgi:two-component system LytT family response regulator
MRVLIVDDERPARDKLHRLLAQEPDVAAIAHACDGVEALAQVESFGPDVLFLDVQMPEVSGIDVAASLPAPAPLVVFATAYDAYALSAFDANAVDYLLKPFDQARLARAMARVRERLAARGAAPGPATGQAVAKLLVLERGVTRVIPVEQIGWLETADNYVVLHTAHGQPLLRQTLSNLVTQLEPAFVRCHRRAAVQVSWIEQVVTLDKGDAELVLRGGMRVPCSRQYKAAVVERL